ncbi:MAG: response regulator [Bacteroidales bacterium]|jgi:two-component system sensor histidine kinase/response regulator|nr:response regulator [Bacteroidales bacterium]
MEVQYNSADFKILIVDDVVSNVILLKALLGKEKYQLVTATNGKSALDILDAEKPDLVLLDVMMPGMSGFEVAEKMKSDPAHKDIPIIFLTALNSSTDIVQGFKVGANDFISKPFNKEELIIRIDHQISLVNAKRVILQQTEELKKIISSRDRIYSVIAHDLRSPIGSIKMVINMLLNNVTEEKIGPDLFEILKGANLTAENTFALLDNLLKWTKSQTGALNVVFQNIDINELIESMVDVFNLMTQVKNISLETYGSKSPILVRADIDMIKTVLRNLLSNAIKFSHKGSSVEIRVEEDEKFAKVYVIDHGVGISEENMEKIMQDNSNLSTYGTENEEGSGLGLLLVKDFVKQNGGEFDIKSVEGEGSTFGFSLQKVSALSGQSSS